MKLNVFKLEEYSEEEKFKYLFVSSTLTKFLCFGLTFIIINIITGWVVFSFIGLIIIAYGIGKSVAIKSSKSPEPPEETVGEGGSFLG